MSQVAAELEALCPKRDAGDVGFAEELGITAIACRECGREYPVSPQHVCEFCFGPLEIIYDYGRISQRLSPARIADGPPSIFRYEALLPVPPRARVDLGAGWSPLRWAPRLAAELGLKRLYLKNDACNPSYSFKDRVVTVALNAARFFGFEVVACASTSNLANSMAAHAAAAGLRSVVFIPSGLEAGKVAATAIFAGDVVAVDGSYDDVNRLCSELVAKHPWAFVNVNLRPFYAEGSKTVAFEIAEQLGWRAPDAVVLPVASGSLLTKVARGFREAGIVGLVEDAAKTAFFGGQAEGCAPVARAFETHAELVDPVKPATIAKSLAIGDPADGDYALAAARASGGRITAVAEERIAQSIELLARTEGIFAEPAGGVTIAALDKLVFEGAITPDQEVVAVITGAGLKTIEAVQGATVVRRAAATTDAVEEALRKEVHG